MLVALTQEEAVHEGPRQYLNRLSDLLFVLGRHLNKVDGHGDVPHADLLTRFVDAATGADGDLNAVRQELVDATDAAFMVDAAAVVGAFEMMTRVADGTGTSHPATRMEAFEPVRDALRLDDYQTARMLAD